MKRGCSVSDSLRPLGIAPVQAVFSDTMQVADIIEWGAAQLGPLEVWQTSFSISEEFLRRLYSLKSAGLMTSLHLVLDYKATGKTLRLWPFMIQVFSDVYLADNHSKAILLRGDMGCCSVITSQNLTRGNRIESYTVIADPSVFSSLLEQFSFIVNKKSVPLNDIFSRHIAAGGEDGIDLPPSL